MPCIMVDLAWCLLPGLTYVCGWTDVRGDDCASAETYMYWVSVFCPIRDFDDINSCGFSRSRCFFSIVVRVRMKLCFTAHGLVSPLKSTYFVSLHFYCTSGVLERPL